MNRSWFFSRICLIALLTGTTVVVHAAATPAADDTATDQAAAAASWWKTPDADQKVLLTQIGIIGFITAWGVTNWDYGARDPHTVDEGWFAQSTAEGGADKTGHFYSTYALGHGLTALFRHYGYDHHRAARVGALGALAAMTYMEIGDSYSPYGFSREDAAMNLAGAAAAWLLAEHLSLADKIALRGEYWPDGNTGGDLFTDYENWRYYATLKLDGFERMPAALRWIELHAGYCARGYADEIAGNEQRYRFVGIGLSLTKLARVSGFRRTATLLDYWQPPHTMLDTSERR